MLAILLFALLGGSSSGYAAGLSPQEHCMVKFDPHIWDLEMMDLENDGLSDDDDCFAGLAHPGHAEVRGEVFGYSMTGSLEAYDSCLFGDVTAQDSREGYFTALYDYIGKRQGMAKAHVKLAIDAVVHLDDPDVSAAALGTLTFASTAGGISRTADMAQGSTYRGGPTISLRPAPGVGLGQVGLIGYGVSKRQDHVMDSRTFLACPIQGFSFTKTSRLALLAHANGIVSSYCHGDIHGRLDSEIQLSECGAPSKGPGSHRSGS